MTDQQADGCGTEPANTQANTQAARPRQPSVSLVSGLGRAARFLVYVWRRFQADGAMQRAGGLTYTSLLALVPLLAVSFALFSAFPAFERYRADIEAFVFDNFLPSIGSAVQSYLTEFTAQTGELGAVSSGMLVVTAVMVLNTISSTFNTIWRVEETRGVVGRILAFWAVLTLTPLLLGASLALSSYLFAIAVGSGVEGWIGQGALAFIAGLLPLLLAVLGFAGLFMFVPNHAVRPRDALVGALVAALLLETLKSLFGSIVSSEVYETLYGAIALLPIFMFWMYLCWNVVLIGAEIAAALPEGRAGRRDPRHREAAPGVRLLAALGVLRTLLAAGMATPPGAAVRAGGVPERVVVHGVPLPADVVTQMLGTLDAAAWIARSDRGHWLLARDLATATLRDLARLLTVTLPTPEQDRLADSDWGRRYADILGRLDRAETELFAVDLRSLLAPAAGTVVIFPGEPAVDPESDIGLKTKLAGVAALVGLGSS